MIVFAMSAFFIVITGGARVLTGRRRGGILGAGWRGLSLAFGALLLMLAVRVYLGRFAQMFAEQLAIGGRLVIPVGGRHGLQTLLKVTRTGDNAFQEEELGAVKFVPLIGESGWAEDGRRSATTQLPGQSQGRSRGRG